MAYNEEEDEIRDDTAAPSDFEEEYEEEESEDSLRPPHPMNRDAGGGYILSGMYRSWFLSYASYVILERAVPYISDGLKPVQRRILYTMSRMDDRLIKVANIVGQVMQLHPHGDASIGDALVQLGQKELMIDTQGNWGNILTGDGAAAPRYIEARLTPLAKRVLFSPKITEYMPSYDGATEEPVNLPVKFPLLLAQGAEGIAVGLSSKILPHNVSELLEACIKYLQGEEFELYPDFPTGGLIDVERYNDGERGGQVKVRAKIEKKDSKILVITEVPFGRTTTSVIESILKANDLGKIKIKKIEDKTAATANIEVHLVPGTSSDKMIDALYAVTDCEVSISPNCCVIRDERPEFLTVSDVLRDGCARTMVYLREELELELRELQERHLSSSLEQLFITRRIYKDKEFEDARTLPDAIAHIRHRLSDVLESSTLIRPVTDDDLKVLLEIKMARILRFNEEKSKLYIAQLEDRMDGIRKKLADVRGVAIDWYRTLLEDYGDRFTRRTEIQSFDVIQAAKVVMKNEKLFVNRKDGFIGTGLKKDEFVSDISSIDDIIVFLEDGSYQIVKVSEKAFVGKNIIHVQRWIKNDARTIYNAIYRDGKNGHTFIKRFDFKTAQRDRVYDLTQGKEGSKVLYFSANPNGEAETVKIVLRPTKTLSGRSQKRLVFEKDFADILIKGRASKGNILTKGSVFKVTLKEQGGSTLGGRKVWFDWDVFRLNYDARGEYIGEFKGEDRVLVVLDNGEMYATSYSDTNHFERNIYLIEKFEPEKVWTAVYFDKESGYTYIKRFTPDEDGKREDLTLSEKNELILLSDEARPRLEVHFKGDDEQREPQIVLAEEFIGVKSIRAKGKRLSNYKVGDIEELDPGEEASEEGGSGDTDVEDNAGRTAEPVGTDAEDNFGLTEKSTDNKVKEEAENRKLIEEAKGRKSFAFDDTEDTTNDRDK